jgi:hypothetical protein
VLPSEGQSNRRDADDGAQHNLVQRRPLMRRGAVFSLADGALCSDEIVHELRTYLPFLPSGSYFLSLTLRHQLMLQLLRFYADMDPRYHPSVGHQAEANPERDGDVEDDVEEIMLGSPRGTPFMRRKATESLEKRKLQRRRDANNFAVDSGNISPRSPVLSIKNKYANMKSKVAEIINAPPASTPARPSSSSRKGSNDPGASYSLPSPASSTASASSARFSSSRRAFGNSSGVASVDRRSFIASGKCSCTEYNTSAIS